jgi:hypothetical protein
MMLPVHFKATQREHGMSFLDGMSDQEAIFRLIMVTKGIARSVDRNFLRKHSSTPVEELLNSFKPQTSYYETPVIQQFLHYIGGNGTVEALLDSFASIENKSPGELWKRLDRSAGLHLIACLREHGDESLRRLSRSICSRSFDDTVDGVKKYTEFVESSDLDTLYTVTLEGNWLGMYMEEYKLLTTSDDKTRDTFATFSLAAIMANPLRTMEHEMNRIKQIHCDAFSTNFLNTGIFTRLTIQANGADIFSIPLKSEYKDGVDNPQDFDADRRTAMNSRGSEGYELNLEAVEVHGGTSKELREIAKAMPRHIALRVRGLALEDALGL